MTVSAETLLAGSPDQYVNHNPIANTPAVATMIAAVDKHNVATMAILSASGVVAAVVRATLAFTKNGVAKTIGIEIPATAMAPIILDFGTHGIVSDKNTTIVLTLPALGAAIIGEVNLIGFTR